ncbi:alpha-1,2-fucosyltransferase [Vibrio sp. Of7-15]|uniref:alpha-1,2-fucosyltransferase n=1 Tax=Vibrio sp. Of7-15 TaxID=2724879 RepID=UPI001EF17BD6|nr:alpha-1,2-fucosyltransferase [Vibrio sp. Of7-15]
MKIVNINSGLGNQMFQFAFYLSLKEKYKNEDVKVDLSWFDSEEFHNGFELEKIFNVSPDYSSRKEVSSLSQVGYSLYSRIMRRLLPRKKSEIIELKENQFSFNPELYGNAGDSNYYLGYWQSYKYFYSIENIVKDTFNFPPFNEFENKSMNSFLEDNKARTVSIHVRRGDYSNHKSLGGLCSIEYYEKAILEVEKKIKNPIFIVFSNDIDWCRENLTFDNVKFVDWNSGELSYRDMQLMSMCNSNILANSSFSWWGAFLNSNEDKLVIAPKVWIRGNDTKDLTPKDWIRI